MRQLYYLIRGRNVYLFLAALCCFHSALAQPTAELNVSGTVVGEGGQTLPGVTVLLKTTPEGRTNNYGTTTDANGRFSLQVPSDAATLVFSFIGLATQEAAIPASGEMTIT